MRKRLSGMGCGLLIGALMVIGALILLWTNEGRVNFGRIAAKSELVLATDLGSVEAGTFVAAQGTLAAVEPLGDPGFLRVGEYLELTRHVEMFAWTENSTTDDSTDSTVYSYAQEWTDSPEDSSTFADQSTDESLHVNPQMVQESYTAKADAARLDGYQVNLIELDLPAAQALRLQDDMLAVDATGASFGQRMVVDDLIYLGSGDVAFPAVGDLRMRYEVVPSGQQVTLFGTAAADRIEPYRHDDENTIYRAFAATKDEAISQMGSEYRFALWGLRIGGNVSMWIGLMLMLAPLTSLLRHIPLFGRMGNALIAFVAALLSFVVSLVVIVVSAIAHNPILLGLIVLAVVGAGVWLWMQRDKEGMDGARVG